MRELFSESNGHVLAHPEMWRVVMADCAPVSPVPRRMAAWCAAHVDRHAHVEICLVLSGTGVYGVRDGVVPVEPGTLLVFPPNTAHQLGYPPRQTPLEHLWMTLLEHSISWQYYRVDGEKAGAQHDLSVVLDSLPLQAMINIPDVDMMPAIRLLRVRALAEMLCATYLEALCKPVTDDTVVFRHRVLDAMAAHIRATSGKDASLDRLARMAGYSPYHFHRMFREHTGKTPQQYIDSCRVVAVREWTAAAMSRKEMALRLGFSCPQAFFRWARKHGC